MSKIEIYYCNLCGDKKEKQNLNTLYWKCDISPQRYVLIKNGVTNSDKHICKECVEIIRQNM